MPLSDRVSLASGLLVCCVCCKLTLSFKREGLGLGLIVNLYVLLAVVRHGNDVAARVTFPFNKTLLASWMHFKMWPDFALSL